MENLLRDIKGAFVYMDYILVSGSAEAEHQHSLDWIMSWLEENGLCLKLAKCVFVATSIEYLGYHVTADGIRLSEAKKEAIVNTPNPQNIGQLRSFVGLLNYYGKFCPTWLTCLLHCIGYFVEVFLGAGGRTRKRPLSERSSNYCLPAFSSILTLKRR